jgi:hypothetical protein
MHISYLDFENINNHIMKLIELLILPRNQYMEPYIFTCVVF